jgi:hypothetical protein
MTRRILLFSFVGLILISLLIGFSYRNPGRIWILDKLRIPVQSAIMAHFGDYHLNYFGILKDYSGSEDMSLTINDLTPYLKILQPGDILFTNSEKYLSSQFIPGEWKHSVIYLGDLNTIISNYGPDHKISRIIKNSYLLPGDKMILDSSVNGVSVRHFQDLSGVANESMLSGISAFRIARDSKTVTRFLIQAIEHLGKPYDYDLITGNTDALYCSELVYESLKHIGIELPVQERLIGRDIISPNGAFNYMMYVGVPAGEFEFLFHIVGLATADLKSNQSD